MYEIVINCIWIDVDVGKMASMLLSIADSIEGC